MAVVVEFQDMPDSHRSCHPLYGDRVVSALHQARCLDVPPGSVKELALKHLMALNLRKLQGSEMSFVPRSYVLQQGNSLEQEFAAFVCDFKISQALAIVKHVSTIQHEIQRNHGNETMIAEAQDHLPPDMKQPEGLWGREIIDIEWEAGPDPSQVVGTSCVSIACAILKRAVESLHASGFICGHAELVSEEEWEIIRAFSPQAQVSLNDSCAVLESTAHLDALATTFQTALIYRNLWVLKPSSGQFGRGILLLDRLPKSLEQCLRWAGSVGRGGVKGANDEKDGCILQKLVERPHILASRVLGSRESHGNCVGKQIFLQEQSSRFKYNLRIWVLASLREPPGIWLYKEGYISLAMKPFTAAPDPLSHITNLRQGKQSLEPDQQASQRRWSLADFSASLDYTVGTGTYETRILPQVRQIVRALFDALGASPSALAPSDADSGRRLRRFGFDLLVDESLVVWLIEVNILKDGFAVGYAQKGAAGDAKRQLVAQLIADEAKLRTAVRTGEGCVPSSFEQLSSAIVVADVDAHKMFCE